LPVSFFVPEPHVNPKPIQFTSQRLRTSLRLVFAQPMALFSFVSQLAAWGPLALFPLGFRAVAHYSRFGPLVAGTSRSLASSFTFFSVGVPRNNFGICLVHNTGGEEVTLKPAFFCLLHLPLNCLLFTPILIPGIPPLGHFSRMSLAFPLFVSTFRPCLHFQSLKAATDKAGKTR